METVVKIENKVTGTVIRQTLSNDDIITISVKSQYDDNKTYHRAKSQSAIIEDMGNQMEDLFKSFNEIFSPKNS